MRSLMSSGRVYIRELLDLVGAIGEDPGAVEEAVRHTYDWHNGRSVAAMQLTFAPAATAVLAIVAKPDSETVLIIAGAAALVMFGVGLGVLLQLNWLHGEYVCAARLSAVLGTFQAELTRYPHGVGAPPGSPARLLYDEIGSTSLVEYRASASCREHVLGVLARTRNPDD
jgi:hypothetical protein